MLLSLYQRLILSYRSFFKLLCGAFRFVVLMRIFYLSFSMCLLLVSQTFAQSLDPVLEKQFQTAEVVPVMILLREQADLSMARQLRGKSAKGQWVYEQLKRTADRTQEPVKNWLASNRVDFRSFWIVNMISADLSREQVVSVDSRPDVLAVYPVMPVVQEPIREERTLEARTPSAIPYGIALVRAQEVWDQGVTGKGVTIGGQDTGVKWDTRAIAEQYRGNLGDTVIHDYAWYDAIHEIDTVNNNDSIVLPSNNPCGLESVVPCDDNGHGTLTLGTALGWDKEMDEQIGMAPDAEWMACRCMERGYGTPVTYMECFQFFLAPTDVLGNNPRPDLAPDVINNSWACPPMEGCHPGNFDVMEMVVGNLRDAGIVVVASAGNTGPDCGSVSTPAAMYQQAFAVGAVAENDSIWRGSSRGPVLVDSSGRVKPDITAPGVRVRTVVPGDRFIEATGTSLAGPHVAGLVALILEARPDLRGEVDLIEEIMRTTAVRKYTLQNCAGDTPETYPNNSYGYGRIDAFEAVELAKRIASSGDHPEPLLETAVFPNPFSDHIRIWRKDHNASAMLILSDPIGREYRLQIPAGEEFFEMNIGSDWPAGHYFYRIVQGQRSVTGKMVRTN